MPTENFKEILNFITLVKNVTRSKFLQTDKIAQTSELHTRPQSLSASVIRHHTACVDFLDIMEKKYYIKAVFWG